MINETISSDFPYESHFIDVNGSRMHYIDHGVGDPILLLHGVPTSSYLWRNIIPHLAPLGRCIAPDLIGMGRSDKPNIAYTVADHIRYIEQFIDALHLKNVTLVMHGVGSIIGLHYAMRHQDNCKGLVFYESYLQPLKGDYLSLPYQEQRYILKEKNLATTKNAADFVEDLLAQLVLRPLKKEELDYYREPFLKEATHKPLQAFIDNILEKEGGPLDQMIDDNAVKLIKSPLPKLLLYSIPGFITTIATVMWAKEHLSNLEIADIGEALHCAQETNPDEMGETISVWLQGVEQSTL